MMKRILLILCLLPSILLAQEVNSWDGCGIKPTSNFRVLNIFINVVYDVHPKRNPNPTGNFWPAVLYSRQEGVNNTAIPTYLSDFMDTGYNANHLHGTLTRIFGESSLDSLQMTGDFVVVNVCESRVLADTHEPDKSFASDAQFGYARIIKVAIDLINAKGGLQTIYRHNRIEDYDYEHKHQFFFTNILIRNITKNYGGLNKGSGIGSIPRYGIKIGDSTYLLNKGTLQCVGTDDISTNPTSVIIHEISHNLFGNNDFHASGGNHRAMAGAMTFLAIQGGYGLMGAAASSLVSCNGYERWRMHWKNPDAPDFISARDLSNSRYLLSDISKDNGPQTFLLRDFVTYGDVIRIQLPYKVSDAASNQYIWLENHQIGNNNKLDFMQYANTSNCRPYGKPGIYAYYQVGRDVFSGTRKEVFFSNERDNLKIIPAEGFWDYELLSDTLNPYNMRCITYEPHTYTILRTSSNAFCGTQDQSSMLFPAPGATSLKTSDEYALWRKQIGSQVIDSLACLGDNRDAFSGHTTLSMSSNPSTCNTIVHYSNNYGSANIRACYTPRNNETIFLSGLSIEITPVQDHNYQVDIRWDSYDITQDVRWTGNVVLKEKAVLTEGHKVVLAQNVTPIQTTLDDESGYFSTVTHFRCEANSQFIQERGTSLVLTEKSTLALDSASTYELNDNAQIIIEKNCTMTISPAARLMMSDNALIVIERGGSLILGDRNIVNHSFTPLKLSAKEIFPVKE